MFEILTSLWLRTSLVLNNWAHKYLFTKASNSRQRCDQVLANSKHDMTLFTVKNSPPKFNNVIETGFLKSADFSLAREICAAD